MKVSSNVHFATSESTTHNFTPKSSIGALWYGENELKGFKKIARSQAQHHGQYNCIRGLEQITSLYRIKKRTIINKTILSAQENMKKINIPELDKVLKLASISSELTKHAKYEAFQEANQDALEACDILKAHPHRFSNSSYSLNSIPRKRTCQDDCRFNNPSLDAKRTCF